MPEELLGKPERMAALVLLGSRYLGSVAEMVRLSDWELSANNRPEIVYALWFAVSLSDTTLCNKTNIRHSQTAKHECMKNRRNL